MVAACAPDRLLILPEVGDASFLVLRTTRAGTAPTLATLAVGQPQLAGVLSEDPPFEVEVYGFTEAFEPTDGAVSVPPPDPLAAWRLSGPSPSARWEPLVPRPLGEALPFGRAPPPPSEPPLEACFRPVHPIFSAPDREIVGLTLVESGTTAALYLVHRSPDEVFEIRRHVFVPPASVEPRGALLYRGEPGVVIDRPTVSRREDELIFADEQGGHYRLVRLTRGASGRFGAPEILTGPVLQPLLDPVLFDHDRRLAYVTKSIEQPVGELWTRSRPRLPLEPSAQWSLPGSVQGLSAGCGGDCLVVGHAQRDFAFHPIDSASPELSLGPAVRFTFPTLARNLSVAVSAAYDLALAVDGGRVVAGRRSVCAAVCLGDAVVVEGWPPVAVAEAAIFLREGSALVTYAPTLPGPEGAGLARFEMESPTRVLAETRRDVFGPTADFLYLYQPALDPDRRQLTLAVGERGWDERSLFRARRADVSERFVDPTKIPFPGESVDDPQFDGADRLFFRAQRADRAVDLGLLTGLAAPRVSYPLRLRPRTTALAVGCGFVFALDYADRPPHALTAHAVVSPEPFSAEPSPVALRMPESPAREHATGDYDQLYVSPDCAGLYLASGSPLQAGVVHFAPFVPCPR